MLDILLIVSILFVLVLFVVKFMNLPCRSKNELDEVCWDGATAQRFSDKVSPENIKSVPESLPDRTMIAKKEVQIPERKENVMEENVKKERQEKRISPNTNMRYPQPIDEEQPPANLTETTFVASGDSNLEKIELKGEFVPILEALPKKLTVSPKPKPKQKPAPIKSTSPASATATFE